MIRPLAESILVVRECRPPVGSGVGEYGDLSSPLAVRFLCFSDLDPTRLVDDKGLCILQAVVGDCGCLSVLLLFVMLSGDGRDAYSCIPYKNPSMGAGPPSPGRH